MTDASVPTTTSWIHGSTGVVQSAHGFLVETLGYYIRLKAEEPAEAWVHFGLPTTTFSWNARTLLNVRIRMRTFEGGTVRKVVVWDGERVAASHGSIEVVREALAVGEAQRENELDRVEFAELLLDLTEVHLVQSAISVSVLVVALAPLDAVAISAVGMEMTIG